MSTDTVTPPADTADAGGTSSEAAPVLDGDPDALGDPGKKALDSMKQQWKQERDRAAAAEAAKAEKDAALELLQKQLATLEGRAEEWEAEQADRAKEQKFLAQANDRIRKAEMRAAAKGVLQDPDDAFAFIDLSSVEVDDDGRVDRDAIAAALDNLISERPYLAVQDGPRFQGGADGGARNGSTKPSQLNRSELADMSAEQITQAKADGRLDDLLGRSTN